MKGIINVMENRMSPKLFVPLILGFGIFATAASAADGDPTAGKRVFAQCSACHTVVKDKNGLGPSLHGVVGRKAGSLESFKNYSPALKNANVVWTEENLDKYLADPKGFIPGNRMIFTGLKKPEDRANVTAYLKQASQE
jgi:cytochrome c2